MSGKMNILIVCGECYAGKGIFISKIEQIFPGVHTIHIGDILRADKRFDFTKQLAASGNDIVEVLKKELQGCYLKGNNFVVIDNPMKNIEQAEAVMKLLSVHTDLISIAWITNNRSNTDYSKRGRVDDNMIPKKIEMWDMESPKMHQYLIDLGVKIFYIENRDEGFLLK